jgi:putative acetyltransferase
MSQKLLEKYKIPYLSIDHLKMGLIRGDSSCGITPTDSNEVIGNKLWPIIKGIIMTNIENKQNIIIEGCYLLPNLVKDFDKKYLDQIISVFIVFSTDYIKQNFASNIIKYRNAIETRDYEEDRPITQFVSEHDELRKKCIENNAVYFEIEIDYGKEIQKVYDYIENGMHKE